MTHNPPQAGRTGAATPQPFNLSPLPSPTHSAIRREQTTRTPVKSFTIRCRGATRTKEKRKKTPPRLWAKLILTAPTFLPSQPGAPSADRRWRDRLRHTQFPAVRLQRRYEMPGSLEREPRGHPLPAPTWTRGPPPPPPNPRGCRGRLEGEGKQTNYPGKIAPPHPTWLRKGTAALGYRQPPLGILRGRSYSITLSPSPPHTGARFPTPCSAPPAFRRNRHKDPPLPASPQQTTQVRSVQSVFRSHPASTPERFFPFLWRPRVTARHTPLCCQPRAARQSHLLPATHSAHSAIRRLAPTPPTAAAHSTARVGAGAPTRRRRDSVS